MRRLAAVAATLTFAACASGGGSAPAARGAAAPAARPAGDPTALRYAPGAGRYRVESQAHSVQEMMGQTQEVDQTTTMVISAALAEDAGNVAAAFTVDSITTTGSTPGMPAPDAARGQTFRAVFSPLGRPVSLTVPDTTSAVLKQMGEQFRDFLPTLPAAPISAGLAWTDTTSESNNLGEITISSRSVRAHRVLGWEDREGVRALKIATTGNYTVSGTGSTQGQELQLEGGGMVTVERFVSAAGVFLGQTSNDSALIRVTVVSMGLEIPVRRQTRTSVSRLP